MATKNRARSTPQPQITDAQIKQMRAEAMANGDRPLVRVADRALSGSLTNRATLARRLADREFYGTSLENWTPRLDHTSYFVVDAQDRANTGRSYEHVIRAADPVEWEDKLALYRSQIPENIQLEVIGSFQAPGFHGSYLEDVERYLYDRSEREAGRPRTTDARRSNPEGKSRRPRFWIGSAAVPTRGGWIQPDSLEAFDDAVRTFERRFGEIIVADSENARGLNSESPLAAREWLAMFFSLPDDFHDDPAFAGAFIQFAMDYRIPIDDALSLYIGPASDHAELGELLIENEGGETNLPIETLRTYFDAQGWARDRELNAEVYMRDGLAFYRP